MASACVVEKQGAMGYEAKSATPCKPPRCPPGLGAPPGLELPLGKAASYKTEPPPGLEDVANRISLRSVSHGAPTANEIASIPVAKVCISGLPKNLLNEPMMEAMMQQANVDSALVGCVLTVGSSSGEVVAKFSNFAAAKRCVRHFEGRRWDASGAVVHCKVTQIVPSVNSTEDKEIPMKRSMEPARISIGSCRVSTNAPAFKPAVGRRTALSTAATPFVPRATRCVENSKIDTLSTITHSEVSTDEETGNSTSEDESVAPVAGVSDDPCAARASDK